MRDVSREAKDRAYWDRLASRYDRSMLLLGGPLPRMVALTVEAVAGKDQVLEVAAGTGLVTRAIAGQVGALVATDYAQAMVEALRARVDQEGLTSVTCEQADLAALRFQDGQFDAVVAANVLHLVPDLDGALAELKRVLRPGGTLVVPTYAHAETWRARGLSWVMRRVGFPGKRRFSTATLVSSVERVGVRVTRVETVPGVLPIAYVQGVV